MQYRAAGARWHAEPAALARSLWRGPLLGLPDPCGVGWSAGLARSVRRGPAAGLARSVRCGQAAGLARSVRRGPAAGLARSVRRGPAAGLARSVRGMSRSLPADGDVPGCAAAAQYAAALLAPPAAAASLPKAAACWTRVPCALASVQVAHRPSSGRPGQGGDGRRWSRSPLAAWGRRGDDLMGKPLRESGQRPGVGGGGETAEADDRGTRRDSGFDRQGPGPPSRPAVTRRAGRGGRAELATEHGERLGLTVQLVAGRAARSVRPARPPAGAAAARSPLAALRPPAGRPGTHR